MLLTISPNKYSTVKVRQGFTGVPRPSGVPLISFGRIIKQAATDCQPAVGTRLSGWLLAPLTGDYVFYMCSDDNGSLRLSPDSSAAAFAGSAAGEVYRAAPKRFRNPLPQDTTPPPLRKLPCRPCQIQR